MKITVDCDICAALSHLPSGSSLAYLLAKGQVRQVDFPLEALICKQYDLQSNPDFPIAAIAATADGLEVGEDYWLRADPVHLALQRDCFSLAEPAPLPVQRPHTALIITSLNQHFSQDGIMFFVGESGAWYLRCQHAPKIKTCLPSLVLDKNIHSFLPTGDESSKWLAVLNEVQMLLHEHPANLSRESAREVAINSIWLSGGGSMPQVEVLKKDADLILASSVFYQGLASLSRVKSQTLPASLADTLHTNAQHVRLQLPLDDNLDEHWFKPMLNALKNGNIQQLTLNLGFYEKSITVEIRPTDCYKFWRKSKPIMEYLK